MIDSLSFCNFMLTLGVIICPFLLIIICVWFCGLTIIKIKDKIIIFQQWRSTPCPNCVYFVDCSELKCAVNPGEVLTKSAVNCRDFQAIIGTRRHDSGIIKHFEKSNKFFLFKPPQTMRFFSFFSLICFRIFWSMVIGLSAIAIPHLNTLGLTH